MHVTSLPPGMYASLNFGATNLAVRSVDRWFAPGHSFLPIIRDYARPLVFHEFPPCRLRRSGREISSGKRSLIRQRPPPTEAAGLREQSFREIGFHHLGSI